MAIWYVEFPTYRYNEDVPALARQSGLVVIDAAATVSRDDAAENPPKLTLKAEYKPNPTKAEAEGTKPEEAKVKP